MRISDWSSDVCSSDLDAAERLGVRTCGAGLAAALEHAFGQVGHHDRGEDLQQLPGLAALQAGGLGDAGLRALLPAAEAVAKDAGAVGLAVLQLGRASCRERVCQDG